jgi:protein-S-isoprenylcysteine O-methyltransferase Ste14
MNSSESRISPVSGLLLGLKIAIFTLVAPCSVAVWIPRALLPPGATPRTDALGIAAPKKLVMAGLYRYVRNPMCIGVLLAVLGECVAFASRDLLVYALIVWTLFHLFVKLYEEPTLRRQFGPAYEDYWRVSRWMPMRGYRVASVDHRV